MQKLNRFVTYIYSYRDSQRDTNVGFAKVDCRGGIVRLEIQIRKKNKGNKRSADLPVSGDTDAAGGNSDRSHEV